MIVIPAIDIKDGQCVRLYQGDFEQVTVFCNDPVQMAKRWVSEGARYLHLVDLDGAAKGYVHNLAVVKAVVESAGVPCELGGGIRDLDTIDSLLALGVDRVILGTAALENQQLVEESCQRWPGRIAVGIDARKGLVATHGWRKTSRVQAMHLAREMVSLGVPRIIYTDIERDGTLTQPNYDAVAELARGLPIPVIASGGVTSLDHIAALLATGAEGVIVGRALYAGTLSLPEAIRLAEGSQAC